MRTQQQLDDFTLAYIEAALWSSNDDSTPQGGEPLDANYGIDDIDPDTLAAMIEDCRRFQEENAPILPATIIRNGRPPSWEGMTSG